MYPIGVQDYGEAYDVDLIDYHSMEQLTMSLKKRKPSHPGVVLDEFYIKPLDLNLQELADNLGISRNTLFKIRLGKASITPSIAVRLAEAFDTTPNLWLNLQQKYDLWIEENEKTHKSIKPVYQIPAKVKHKTRPRRTKTAA